MNNEKISRKAEYIFDKITYLKENKPRNLEHFTCDEKLQMSILYAMHVSIEATVDIAILVGINVHEIPYNGDYEMFESLFKEGVIDNEVFDKLRKLNGLRNAIVHAYDSLIIEEIYDNYSDVIGDISCVIGALVEVP